MFSFCSETMLVLNTVVVENMLIKSIHFFFPSIDNLTVNMSCLLNLVLVTKEDCMPLPERIIFIRSSCLNHTDNICTIVQNVCTASWVRNHLWVEGSVATTLHVSLLIATEQIISHTVDKTCLYLNLDKRFSMIEFYPHCFFFAREPSSKDLSNMHTVEYRPCAIFKK